MLKISKAVVLVALSLSVLFMTGCDSTTHSSEQQVKKYGRIWQNNAKIVQDDFDKFFLLDANTRLTKWHTIAIE